MFWGDAFKRVQPGEKPPDPPQSLKTWASQTVYGLTGGMIFGGYKGLRQSSNPSIPSPVPANSAQQRAAMFFVKESILTGSRIGIFASMFSATALFVEHARDVHDVANYAAAGAFTCGLFGAGSAGLPAFVPAAAFGGLIAGAVGATRDYVNGLMVVEEEVGPDRLSVRDVVDGMQSSLETHPLRIEQRDEKDASPPS